MIHLPRRALKGLAATILVRDEAMRMADAPDVGTALRDEFMALAKDADEQALECLRTSGCPELILALDNL